MNCRTDEEPDLDDPYWDDGGSIYLPPDERQRLQEKKNSVFRSLLDRLPALPAAIHVRSSDGQASNGDR